VVLRECDVPKGSFYHYFASKEAFGYALLESYQAFYMQRLNKWFVDQPTDGLGQLQAAMDGFLGDSIAGIERYGYRRGCLVGALGQEVAGLHEGFRSKLLENLQYWDKTLGKALFNCASSYQKNSSKGSKNSKTTGLLQTQNAPQNDPQTMLECDKMAQEFWAMWEGAVLRSLLAQNPEMLRAAVYRFMGQFAFWLTGLQSKPNASKPLVNAEAKLRSKLESAETSPALWPNKKKMIVTQKSEKPLKINDVQSGFNF
jgi:TetR/AcrR family transcriptional regulator, transcriptional repressor for nem operon